jgi:DNA-binding IclR family transcriptional regulator
MDHRSEGSLVSAQAAPKVTRRPSGIAALAVLEQLAGSPAGLRLTEIARRLDIDPGQAHRAVNGLLATGYVEQDTDSHLYRATAKLVSLASVLLHAMDVVTLARPRISRLRLRTGETVHLAQQVGDEAVCVARELSEHPVAVTTAIGERFGRQSAVGKAIAIGRDGDRSKASGRPAFVTDDGIGRPGVRCAAAPVSDWQGRTVAVIAVSGPSERISKHRLQELGADVAATARELSTALGAAGLTGGNGGRHREE